MTNKTYKEETFQDFSHSRNQISLALPSFWHNLLTHVIQLRATAARGRRDVEAVFEAGHVAPATDGISNPTRESRKSSMSPEAVA